MTPHAVELTSEAEKLVPLCNADMVRVDQARRVELPPWSAEVVFRFNDQFFVIDDECTYGSGSLAAGELIDDVVGWPFHVGAFDFRTGAVDSSPCVTPVRTHRSRQINGVSFLAVDG